MNCPYGYDCLHCPEGEDFDCDYDLSLEEIIASDAMDSEIEAVNPKKTASEKSIAWRKEYYQSNKTKIREYQKEYYQKNKVKRKEYYQKNKECIRAYTKHYQQTHKEEVAMLQRKYRQRKNKKGIGETEINDQGK